MTQSKVQPIFAKTCNYVIVNRQTKLQKYTFYLFPECHPVRWQPLLQNSDIHYDPFAIGPDFVETVLHFLVEFLPDFFYFSWNIMFKLQ